MTTAKTLSMVVCRDYRDHSSYEFVISARSSDDDDGEIVARKGFFKSYAAAKAAGLRAAQAL